jgi:hypothetical protein
VAVKKKAVRKKKAAKKKAGKRKAAKKKATKKKAGKRKATKKKTARRGKKSARVDLVGSELPKSLKAFGKQLRRDLSEIEKRIETAGKEARRGLARVVRDASHQLGKLEARGEREWRSLSKKAQGDVDKVAKRVRKVLNS